jgi:hypothetical protein
MSSLPSAASPPSTLDGVIDGALQRLQLKGLATVSTPSRRTQHGKVSAS